MPIPIIALVGVAAVVLVKRGLELPSEEELWEVIEKIKEPFSSESEEHDELAKKIEVSIKSVVDPDLFIKNRIKIQEMASKIATAHNTGTITQYNTLSSQEKFLS